MNSIIKMSGRHGEEKVVYNRFERKVMVFGFLTLSLEHQFKEALADILLLALVGLLLIFPIVDFSFSSVLAIAVFLLLMAIRYGFARDFSDKVIDRYENKGYMKVSEMINGSDIMSRKIGDYEDFISRKGLLEDEDEAARQMDIDMYGNSYASQSYRSNEFDELDNYYNDLDSGSSSFDDFD